jgi:DNA polymerase
VRGGGDREALLRGARTLLSDLLAEGVDHVMRPPPLGATQLVGPVDEGRPPEGPPARPRGPSEPELFASRHAESLEEIRADLGECTRCRLCEGRAHIVFGEGSPRAKVVFVGEGPGSEEDRTGRPFVGRAGELLTKMILSVGWRREDVYICNIVKCRPPENREPRPDEVGACRRFLERQLRSIGPRVIVALGRPAASMLLGQAVAISKVRGLWQEWEGIPVMPTYHPAYLLRSYTRENRQAVWDDLRAVRARVEGTSDG